MTVGEHLLIIAAALFEVEETVQKLRDQGIDAHAKPIGVGALAAAYNARTLADQCAGANVFFLGTCGTFARFEEVRLVQVGSAHWLPTSDRLGLSYTVQGICPPRQLPKPPEALTALPSLPIVTAICGPSISLDATLPSTFPRETSVENLELYSVLPDVAERAKSFAAILAVTNGVGPSAHQEWRRNFRTAAILTAEYLAQLGKKS